MATTMVSSSATLSTASPVHQVCSSAMCWPTKIDAPTHSTVSTSSEGMPDLPSASRSVRASGGRAGTRWGLKIARAMMNSA
ncbi:hypothetical protein D3C80_2063970 [compost metagenome]